MVRYNPEAVWPVPEGFRSIYAHGVELRSNARLLFVSGQIGIAPDGSLAPDFAAQCEVANVMFQWIRGKVGDARLLFCPTPYCGRMAAIADEVSR